MKTSRKFENEPKSPKLWNHEKMTGLTSWVSQVYESFQNGPPYNHNPSCIAQRVRGVQAGSFKVVAPIDKWTSALKDGHTSTELLRLREWIWIARRLLWPNTLTTLEESKNLQKKTDRIYNHHPHLESRCWPQADAWNWQWKRRSSICGLALRVKG